MLAAEDVQRQVAVAAVVAVKEAPRLIAVQAVVGGLELEYDPRRLPLLALDGEIHQCLVGRGEVESDLLVARGFAGIGGRSLQPVEGALASSRGAALTLAAAFSAFRVGLAREHRQQRAGEAETRLGTLCPSEGRWLLVETC